MKSITRYRGDDWGLAVEISGVDIEDATFQAQARPSFDSDVVYEFTCTKDESATPSSRVDCSLPAHITETIEYQTLIFDIEMTLDGSIQTLMQLRIEVLKDVTR